MITKTQLKRWIERNEILFKSYNFKVYEVFYYIGNFSKDFPELTPEDVSNEFEFFCNVEFDSFKAENDLELCRYIGSTSSFYVLPKEFYNYVDIRRDTVNFEDFYNFIQNEYIENFQELERYFGKCKEFINNLLRFKSQQVEIFKSYLEELTEERRQEKKEEQEAHEIKMRHFKNIIDALNLYIDIVTPHDLANYNINIESFKQTLQEVEKWQTAETTLHV